LFPIAVNDGKDDGKIVRRRPPSVERGFMTRQFAEAVDGPLVVPPRVYDQAPLDAERRRQKGPCRLTFSINAGRSGSAYLAAILKAVHGVTVEHEGRPDMAIGWMPHCKEHGLAASFGARSWAKTRPIAAKLNGARGRRWYVETSHLFIKSFWDVAMAHFYTRLGCNVNVVVLRRYAPDVVKSMLRLGFDAVEQQGWYHLPGDAMAALNYVPMESERMRAIGYLYDIEAKTSEFRRRFANVDMIDVRVENLNTATSIRRLYRQLGLSDDSSGIAMPTSTQLDELAGRPVNTKPAEKPTHASEAAGDDTVAAEADIIGDVEQFRRLYKKLWNIDLPPLPAMSRVS
jgi:hypothetical protein